MIRTKQKQQILSVEEILSAEINNVIVKNTGINYVKHESAQHITKQLTDNTQIYKKEHTRKQNLIADTILRTMPCELSIEKQKSGTFINLNSHFFTFHDFSKCARGTKHDAEITKEYSTLQ